MKTEEIEQRVRDTLIKLEDTKYLLEEGKTIIAYNKLLGVRQKLALILGDLQKKKEGQA
tara:strand:+ start:28837 stop:29013 length:177 start_codon:yes stop_codon:yes gene_type:complete